MKVFAFLLFFLTIPFIANGHVKWFTKSAPVKESIENILSPFFMTIALITALVLGILPQILPKLMEWKPVEKFDETLDRLRKFSPLLLRYGTAVALIVQVLSGSLLAPEIHINTFGYIVGAAVIVLLLIPHHFAHKIAAAALVLAFIEATFRIGTFHMLDYGFYVAIAFALFVQKTKIETWGTPFLYLGTGLSLCWVAVEKWVFPGLSMDIIASHGVPTFGFSPEMFISISAFIEFVVGYLLVVGVLNRILALVLTLIFFMTTTLFGAVEIVGHLIVHFILIVFILEGISFYKPPIKIHQTMLDQIIFVFLNFLFVLGAMILIYYRFA
ncbi:hypothetical protein DS031_17020 [Bacillus taeanensis]|uniref:DoxX family membrane protein n=1 Tax=Bacillus taeanensis TaxID=273032 RepID=A0A366XTD8_9BACI|nr:hypothetical protein DS031_17020 [Bacillus taeanensis]